MKTRKVLNKGFVTLLGILGKDVVRDKSNIMLQFEIKCPLFLTNRFYFYKQGSFVKEFRDEFYIPAFYFKDDGTSFTEQEDNELSSKFDNFSHWANNFYKKLLTKGLTKEQAKMILPQNTYTQFYWTVDLKTLLFFLKWQYQDKSSYEMQQYSKVLLDFVKENLPIIGAVFENEL